MSFELAALLLGSPLVRALAADVGTAIASRAVQGAAAAAWKRRSNTESNPRTRREQSLLEPTPAAAQAVSRSTKRPTALHVVPAVEVSSSLPGRVRLRVQGLRGDPERAAALTHRLRAARGVTAAGANHLTGSVLVQFDPARTDRERIVRATDQCWSSVGQAAVGVRAARVTRSQAQATA